MGKHKNNKSGHSVQEVKLVLNMIVKNEGHLVDKNPYRPNDETKVPVIQRCLDNVGHLIDAIAIVDTGSTDNTIEIINNWAEEKKIPCQVIVDPWRDNFGYSRNVALDHGLAVVEKIKKKELKYSPEDGNYSLWYYLFMDADNLAFANDSLSPFILNKNNLSTADVHQVNMRQGGSQYGYVWLVKIDPNKLWRWYGPLHEYISPLKDETTKKVTWEAKFGHLEGGYIDSRREGSRSLNHNKYLRDAIIFEKELLDDPMNDRYLYYLAQSYKDAARMFNEQAMKEKEKLNDTSLSSDEKYQHESKYIQLTQKITDLWKRAEKAFLYRASMPPFKQWTDEYTYHAWLEAGKVRQYRKGKYDDKCILYFSRAYHMRPQRLEAPYFLLNYYLTIEAYRLGWDLAKDLIRLPYPKNERIFVDDDIHEFRFIFEASLCAFYADAKDDFITLSKRVVRNEKTPENIRKAAKSNLDRFSK